MDNYKKEGTSILQLQVDMIWFQTLSYIPKLCRHEVKDIIKNVGDELFHQLIYSRYKRIYP